MIDPGVHVPAQGIDITIEVHEVKEPFDTYAGRLPYLYLEMRDPLLAFVSSVHHSIQVQRDNRTPSA